MASPSHPTHTHTAHPPHHCAAEVLGILPDGWNVDWIGGAFPPTAFLSMPRDAKSAARIATDVALLASYGVPADVLEVRRPG